MCSGFKKRADYPTQMCSASVNVTQTKSPASKQGFEVQFCRTPGVALRTPGVALRAPGVALVALFAHVAQLVADQRAYSSSRAAAISSVMFIVL